MLFTWERDQGTTFLELRMALASDHGLLHFKVGAPTEIPTDVTCYGFGEVLVQQVSGKEQVNLYASGSRSNAELNYSTSKKEGLAVVWVISKGSTLSLRLLERNKKNFNEYPFYLFIYTLSKGTEDACMHGQAIVAGYKA